MPKQFELSIKHNPQKTDNNITSDVNDKYSKQNLRRKKADKLSTSSILTKEIKNPVWFSVSESAKLGGVQTKTIRRAIQSGIIQYKVISNRYFINLTSLITYLHTTTKLKNKLNKFGIGQYIGKWRS